MPRHVSTRSPRLPAALPPATINRTESDEEAEFPGAVAERFWTGHRTGNTVSVVYDPDNPDRAKINEFTEIWFAPAILFLVGLGAALIPPITIWRHYRS